jgi:hypothetical protein
MRRCPRFLEHRIGDKRIIRLIQKWLRAGILEDGVVTVDDRGTGQGSVISPILPRPIPLCLGGSRFSMLLARPAYLRGAAHLSVSLLYRKVAAPK